MSKKVEIELDIEFFDGVAVVTEPDLRQWVNPPGLLGRLISEYVEGDTRPDREYGVVLKIEPTRL